MPLPSRVGRLNPECFTPSIGNESLERNLHYYVRSLLRARDIDCNITYLRKDIGTSKDAFALKKYYLLFLSSTLSELEEELKIKLPIEMLCISGNKRSAIASS